MDLKLKKENITNNKRYIHLAITMLLSLILVAPSAVAEQAPEMLSETWVMIPKAGKSDDMEEAIKKHIDYRNKLQDPRKWKLYSPVLGDNLDMVAVRSFGFGWQDMDSYKKWSEEKDTQKHWNKYVDKYVAKYEHYMSVLDYANSNWGPDVKYRYVGVTNRVVKAGHGRAVNEDIKIMSDAAKAQKWPFNWSWSEGVSGPYSIQLAAPYENWASMAPPETKFAEVLAEHLGSMEKALEVFARWNSHFESSEYNIWALKED